MIDLLHCLRRARARMRVWFLLLALSGHWLSGMALAAGSAGGADALSKLDAPLLLFATQPEDAVKLFRERVRMPAGIEKAAVGGRISVLIRLADGADEATAMAALKEAGVVVRSRLGPIVTAEVPVSAVARMAAVDEVTSVELSRPVTPRLNFSVPSTNATALRSGVAPNWSGLTGKGVIVGIIDDGVDFRHRDFRNPDGSTRLLALWDQAPPEGAPGQPPAGYTAGVECTPAMIGAGIAGTAGGCAQTSSGGHGTHVAGIAAGNGQATGEAQPAYRFVGMAPQADILSSSGGGVLDAIAWMKDKAKAAGKPLVINMSFGSYFGPRDGTSNFEVGLSSAGGPGVILVGAAGNEATAPIRAEGPLTQGGQLTFDLNVPENREFLQMEAWYPGGDSYSVSIKGPNCPATQAIGTDVPNVPVETACGQINVTNAGPFPNNDDRQLLIILATGTSPLAPGAWRVTFTGTRVAAANAKVSIVTGEVNGGLTVTAVNGQPFTGVTTQILTDVSSARRVIAVGSYNTNYAFTTFQGTPSDSRPTSGPVGDLSSFSSRGPRRMCSNPVKCPPIMKPEIIAPGSRIVSTLAADEPTTPESQSRERDGVHISKVGTSMATPHVTGAIALLLQKNPSLTPEDVKRLLFTNIQKTTFTPAVPAFTGADVPAAPNYDWGYGMLDVAKAAAATPAAAQATVLTAFEFLYQPENRYFLTIDPGEAAAIDAGAAGAGWLRTGFTFKAYSVSGEAPAGAVSVCRFYGSVTPGPNSHFFTANPVECQALRDLQATTPNTQKRWNYEGIAFRITQPAGQNCAAGLTPVLRAYNNGFTRGIDSNHRFTTSQAEYQKMIGQGWSGEGVVFCSPA